LLSLRHVSAIVLAGGRATRMGGLDKGLQPYQGKSLVAHCIARLNQQIDGPLYTVMISANRHLDQYQLLGLPVFCDAVGLSAQSRKQTQGALQTQVLEQSSGPLAGMFTGLTHCSTPYLLTVPCDTPLLALDLTKRLLLALTEQNADIAIVASPSLDAPGSLRSQPTIALMRSSLKLSLQDSLNRNEFKVSRWMRQHKLIEVAFDQSHDDLAAFTNINSSEQLVSLNARSLQ
jgi:molybdenum cofactor guanylyltransferase